MKQENYEEFHRNLYKLWQADKYCDIVLISADEKTKIPAHRIVLEAASPYFATRATDSKENITEITVPTIDGATLQLLVGVCYSGSLEVDENNVSSVYMGAVHLQLNGILTALDNHIVEHLNNSNCLHFYKLAEIFSRSVLFEAAEKYVCAHFSEICGRSAFLKLDTAYLNKLLSLKAVRVSSAEDIFRKVIKWLQHDFDGLRENALPELLPNLRLSSMSPSFLQEHVNPLCKTIEAKNSVIAALGKHLQSIPPELAADGSLHAPVAVRREHLIVVARDYDCLGDIKVYSFEQQKWQSIAGYNVAKFAVTYSMALNSLCFIGGDRHGSAINDVHLWNLQNHKFSKMKDMIEPRCWAGVLSLNDNNDAFGDLIILGGKNSGKSLSTVERWSHKSGKWHSLKTLNESRYDGTQLAVGYLVYCIGGTLKTRKSVQCYNLAENFWSTLAPLHHERMLGTVMNEGEKLYVIGGGSDVIECYDPVTTVWTEICTVQGIGSVRSCVRHNNRLVAFGNNTVFTSDGDWTEWKENATIAAVNRYIYGAFSIPLR